MNSTVHCIRGVISALLAYLSAKMGILFPVMVILIVTMAFDFITAWSAARLTGVPICSKKCGHGILKKTLYIICVGCGLIVDRLILSVAAHIGADGVYSPVFGLLVAIWLILNELVSILENLKKAGAPIPA